MSIPNKERATWDKGGVYIGIMGSYTVKGNLGNIGVWNSKALILRSKRGEPVLVPLIS